MARQIKNSTKSQASPVTSHFHYIVANILKSHEKRQGLANSLGGPYVGHEDGNAGIDAPVGSRQLPELLHV